MTSNNALKKIIAKEILEQGPISFARYMELALYNDEYGYYMRNSDNIGPSGDFYTSSNVSEVFGQTLANHFKELKKELCAAELNIFEFGAGTGQLAYDILSYLHKMNLNVSYSIVEISPAMIEMQKEKLSSFTQVYWQKKEDLNENGIKGIVLSNELVDALPFHRVIVSGGRLNELLVDYDKKNDKLISIVMPASAELLSYMNKYGKKLNENQIAEINLNALNWLDNTSKLLNSGYIITIDYGEEFSDIYSDSRPEGTAISFMNHKASTDFYNDIGEKDITCHVNFSALLEFGKQIGLEKIYYNSQSGYLHEHGAIEILKNKFESIDSPVEKFKAQLNFKNLFLPQGMGERFKVLVQKK